MTNPRDRPPPRTARVLDPDVARAADPLLWDGRGGVDGGVRELPAVPAAGRVHLDATWRCPTGVAGLRAAVDGWLRGGGRGRRRERIQIVCDEEAGPMRAPVPSVLAVGAVNTALVQAGHRTRTSIVVQTDDARESHHVACLLAFGAEAVLPLAPPLSRRSRAAPVTTTRRLHGAGRYRALEEGVLKVLAKLGISCVDSYRGAQTSTPWGSRRDLRTCFSGRSRRSAG